MIVTEPPPFSLNELRGASLDETVCQKRHQHDADTTRGARAAIIYVGFVAMRSDTIRRSNHASDHRTIYQCRGLRLRRSGDVLPVDPNLRRPSRRVDQQEFGDALRIHQHLGRLHPPPGEPPPTENPLRLLEQPVSCPRPQQQFSRSAAACMNACSFGSNRAKRNLVRVTFALDYGLTPGPQILKGLNTTAVVTDRRPRVEKTLSKLFRQPVNTLLRPDSSLNRTH